jgi:DNA-binding CsgD family transcriptional regulator
MVRWTDVRRLLRLMREANELLTAGSDPTLHVISGLGGIVGADASATADATDFRPTGRVTVGPIVSAGLSQNDLDGIFRTYALEGAGADPVVPIMATRHGAQPVYTCTRWESVTREQWDRSSVAEGMRGLSESLYSTRLTGEDNRCNGVMLLRRNTPFDEESKNLVRLFHLECYRELGERRNVAAAHAIIEGLPRRQRETLDCLLRGDSEKGAAARMNVSPHTLHNYVKALYSAFGVSSRPELLALCLRTSR